jgi:hypothetical protein
MAATLSETEAAPSAWPEIAVDGLDAAATAAVWRRLESFIAWRFAPRAVVCTVEGPGAWRPRLRPFAVETVEAWTDDGGWTAATLAPEPLGGVSLPGTGPYRITCTVGAGATVPADVAEAARRLGEYQLAIAGGDAALVREEIGVGEIRLTAARPAAWTARALQHSGAADLLRPYRGLGAAA